MPDAVRAAGGAIFAVTSEPQSLATEAEETWGFGFPSVGDPHHEILDTTRERDWLDLFVNTNHSHLNGRSWAAHPKGYFQPGVLALTSEGRVLYRWRCRPTRHNVGGAIERPTPEYVWERVQAQLDGTAGDAPLDDSPTMDAKPVPWPAFVARLLAHGWFLRPKVFPLGREGEKPSANPQAMTPRLIGFVVLWIVAFALLPAGWVALALVAWAVALIPGLRTLHREFQNEPAGDPLGSPVSQPEQ